MKKFLVVWLGQLVSVAGSSLSAFALGVWVYQETGSATDYVMIQFFAQLVFFLVNPFAGVIVDRWNRRDTMVLADLGSGLCTLMMFLIIYYDALNLYLIYLLVSLSSGFGAIQSIAYKAAVAQMVPVQQLGRAAGMVESAGGLATIVAPVISALLMGVIGLKGIFLIDFTTFLFALGTLLATRIPNPKISAEGAQLKGGFFKEAFIGFGYVRKRKALFILLLYLAGVNFLVCSVMALATPMILSYSSAERLGTLLTICGVGGLCGGLLMSLWGGPKNQVRGVMVSQFVGSIAAILVGFSSAFYVISVAGFVYFFAMPISLSCLQAIWQRKVPHDLQGRVFSTRQTIAFSSIPLAYGLSGPLADHLFEPLLMADGLLADSVGRVIGVGPGRGIGLLYIIYGTIFALLTLWISRNPSLRRLDQDIPDADSASQTEVA